MPNSKGWLTKVEARAIVRAWIQEEQAAGRLPVQGIEMRTGRHAVKGGFRWFRVVEKDSKGDVYLQVIMKVYDNQTILITKDKR